MQDRPVSTDVTFFLCYDVNPGFHPGDAINTCLAIFVLGTIWWQFYCGRTAEKPSRQL